MEVGNLSGECAPFSHERIYNQWIERVDKYLVNRRKNVTIREISGEEAAQTIFSHEPPTVVPVTCGIELSRLGLKLNDAVAVIPDDTGWFTSSMPRIDLTALKARMGSLLEFCWA